MYNRSGSTAVTETEKQLLIVFDRFAGVSEGVTKLTIEPGKTPETKHVGFSLIDKNMRATVKPHAFIGKSLLGGKERTVLATVSTALSSTEGMRMATLNVMTIVPLDTDFFTFVEKNTGLPFLIGAQFYTVHEKDVVAPPVMSPITVAMAAYARAVKGLSYTKKLRENYAYFGELQLGKFASENRAYFANETTTNLLKRLVTYELAAMRLPVDYFGQIDMAQMVDTFCDFMRKAVQSSVLVDRFGDFVQTLSQTHK